jgi:hypothetical protein
MMRGAKSFTFLCANGLQPEIREWWGKNYEVYDKWGLAMVWQDEMCPGIAGTIMKTLPLYIRQYDFGRCAPSLPAWMDACHP